MCDGVRKIMNKGEEGKLLQGIYRLSDSLVSLSEKIEKKPGHVPELIVIICMKVKCRTT